MSSASPSPLPSPSPAQASIPLLTIDVGQLSRSEHLSLDSCQLAVISHQLLKVKSSLPHGQRLENLSLRLWHKSILDDTSTSSNPSLFVTLPNHPPTLPIDPGPLLTPSLLALLFTSILHDHPFEHHAFVPLRPNFSRHSSSTTPIPSHCDLVDSTPRSGSPPNPSALTQLTAPPQIFSIAPTPPIASSPIHPPTCLTSDPSPLLQPAQQLPITQIHHLHLSPQPNQTFDQPPSDCSSNHPPSTSSDFTDPKIIDPSRPSIGMRYSSDATTPSSVGIKSLATSLSVEGRDEQLARLRTHTDHNKIHSKYLHHSKSSASIHPTYRRSTSTAGLKHKSRPLSYVRLFSHTSSRSVSPHLTQPSRENQESLWLDDLGSKTAKASCHSDSPRNLDSQPVNLSHPAQSSILPQQSSSPLTNLSGQSIHQSGPPHKSVLRTATVVGYKSSESLPSLVSPIIPVTPNNSRVSAPFRILEGDRIPHSLASSHATGISPSFLPSAPPPTPAEDGAHLPTTMSAADIKSKPSQRVPVAPSQTTVTIGGAGGKKKAKFFIKESEADDDRLYSPPTAPAQSTTVVRRVLTDVDTRTSPAVPVAFSKEPSAMPQKQNKPPPNGSGREVDELDGTDSDEWGSEYSDDECDEDDSKLVEKRKAQEFAKKSTEDYYRELFAKKHFVQRNQSHDGSDQPPPIRRAGLSMLFHPELNHLQHHPQSSQRAGAAIAPIRNQSSMELRRQGSSSLSSQRLADNGLPLSPTHGPRSSHGLPPRPSSLIKSKSSVAVPVLAGHEPPAMVQRSPSSHDSVTRESQQQRRGSSNGIINRTQPVVAHQQPPPRSLPQQQNHQRHPSRLGGKPQNVEYSDDDSDSDQGEEDTSGNCKKEGVITMTEEQERRLGRFAQKYTKPSPTSRTEPIVLDTTQPSRPQLIAAPLSPRTTRNKMLSNELTESLRRNLIWQRRMGAQALGVVINDNPSTNLEDATVEIDSIVHRGLVDPRRGTGSSSDLARVGLNESALLSRNRHGSTTTVNKEYRNFSKGFHRTGW